MKIILLSDVLDVAPKTGFLTNVQSVMLCVENVKINLILPFFFRVVLSIPMIALFMMR